MERKSAEMAGVRANARVDYELPRELVTGAIVNAVVHRDYASNASVQVMLFSDRLEIWNRGRDQRLEQHVAGAKLKPAAARRWMQAGHRKRPPGLDPAGDGRIVDRSFGPQGDTGGTAIRFVARLDGRLQGPQFIALHRALIFYSPFGRLTSNALSLSASASF